MGYGIDLFICRPIDAILCPHCEKVVKDLFLVMCCLNAFCQKCIPKADSDMKPKCMACSKEVPGVVKNNITKDLTNA